VGDLAITLGAGPHGNQGNVIVVKARRRAGAWGCWSFRMATNMGYCRDAGASERTSWKSLERDANVQAYRRRMVGDLKIHQTCSGNDDDILNEAK